MRAGTNLWAEQFFEVGFDEVDDALGRPWQRDAADHEHSEHDVGEGGGEVGDLARALDALAHEENDENPGQQQT